MRNLAIGLTALGDIPLLSGLYSIAPQAPKASKGFAARTRMFAAELRHCDPANDHEFRSYIWQVAILNILGLQQKEIARRLMVTPLTLQRWGQGKNLPYALPRRAYLTELANLADEIANDLEVGCMEPVGEPKEASEAAKDHFAAPKLALVAG